MSSIIEIKGRVHHDSGVQTFGSKGFQKRTLVIETNDKFNNLLPIDLISDQLDTAATVGDELTAECYLNGSSPKYFKGRAFLSLTVHDINVSGKTDTASEAPGETPF